MRELSHDSSSHENKGTKKIIYLYRVIRTPTNNPYFRVIRTPLLILKKVSQKLFNLKITLLFIFHKTIQPAACSSEQIRECYTWMKCVFTLYSLCIMVKTYKNKRAGFLRLFQVYVRKHIP